MGLFDTSSLTTHSGYGGQPTFSGWGAIETRLQGIGQTTCGGHLGETAIEALQKYRASGATDEQIQASADEIARKHGRY